MNVGTNLENLKVTLSMQANGSAITTTVEFNPNFARALAAQLIASADALDESTSNGFLKESD